MPRRLLASNRLTLESAHARSMLRLEKRLLPCLPCFACARFSGSRNSPKRPSGEERRIIALESAWDQAEQNKDSNALENLLVENLIYVDYDRSISTKRQFRASVKRADIAGEQINNEGLTVHFYGNDVAARTGIYRDKGRQNGKRFSRRRRLANVWLNQNGRWECLASQSTLITH